MKNTLGLLFLIGAGVCGTLAYTNRGAGLDEVIRTHWVALPLGALGCLLLGLALLLGIKRAFGVFFLLAAATCLLFAYAIGGPAWQESFDPRRMIRQGGHYVALGGVVCLVLGLPLIFGRKRPQ